ncbi:alpha/beta hydrolase family protein [Anaerobaca lacustris]|uniref:Alpha/beta hydrolase n=1 Tax=Anaerobaca lacustris TaxID=3044600 RepID=A0AAW6U0Z0_9BACT|nr:alpha/beta hydrolase [Sedimentisphaerales bacterium M17dextr]
MNGITRIRHSHMALPLLIVFSVIASCQAGVPDGSPVREEEMDVSRDDVRLSGTLTLPVGEGPFPVVVLISGSGPQNRDWDFDWNGEYLMGRIFANDLARHRIAVFRYDDRGTGKSTGQGEDIRDLTQDVLSIVESLRKKTVIGPVGLCGHSLGAAVALHTAAACDGIDFLILLSPPLVTGKEIMLAQAREMPDMYRSSKEQTNEEASLDGMEFVRSIADVSGDDQTREKAISIFVKIFRYHSANSTADDQSTSNDAEERLRKDAQNLVEHFRSPGNQFFLHYDPVSDLKGVACPIAVLFGEGDRHVKLDVNLKPLLDGVTQSTISNFTLKVVPEINHFYTCPPHRTKGQMYPGVTDFLGRWILNSI